MFRKLIPPSFQAKVVFPLGPLSTDDSVTGLLWAKRWHRTAVRLLAAFRDESGLILGVTVCGGGTTNASRIFRAYGLWSDSSDEGSAKGLTPVDASHNDWRKSRRHSDQISSRWCLLGILSYWFGPQFRRRRSRTGRIMSSQAGAVRWENASRDRSLSSRTSSACRTAWRKSRRGMCGSD